MYAVVLRDGQRMRGHNFLTNSVQTSDIYFVVNRRDQTTKERGGGEMHLSSSSSVQKINLQNVSCLFFPCFSEFRLVRIRIGGPVPLTNGFGSGTLIFLKACHTVHLVSHTLFDSIASMQCSFNISWLKEYSKEDSEKYRKEYKKEDSKVFYVPETHIMDFIQRS